MKFALVKSHHFNIVSKDPRKGKYMLMSQTHKKNPPLNIILSIEPYLLYYIFSYIFKLQTHYKQTYAQKIG